MSGPQAATGARRGHLLRAAAAALGIAGLALMLPGGEAPSPAEAPNPTAAAVAVDESGPPASAAAPEPAPADAAQAPPEAPLAREDAPPSETSSAPEGDASDAATDGSARADVEASVAPPAAPGEPAVRTERPASSTPGRGYMVQLGVFGAPENAERLRDELAAQGYEAYMQSRVIVGPYADRKAADAAQARLKAERKLDGVILPPRRP